MKQQIRGTIVYQYFIDKVQEDSRGHVDKIKNKREKESFWFWDLQHSPLCGMGLKIQYYIPKSIGVIGSTLNSSFIIKIL